MLRIPVEAKNVALAAKVTRGLCASGESDIFRTLLGDRIEEINFFCVLARRCRNRIRGQVSDCELF
jgi:hypothetical protein